MNAIDTESIVFADTGQSVAQPIDVDSISFEKTETSPRPGLFDVVKGALAGPAMGLVPRVQYDLQNTEYRLREDKNRPALVDSISNVTGLPAEEVNKYYSPLRMLFDASVSGPAGAAADVSPETTEGIVNATMTPAIVAGAVANPVGTAVGLVAFTALDHFFPTPQIEGATKDEQASINLIGMIAKGAVVGGLFHGASKVKSQWFPDLLEKFGYKKMKENGLPDVIQAGPEQLNKLQGKEIIPEVKNAAGKIEEPQKIVEYEAQAKDFLDLLGLDRHKVETAVANNLSIPIPAERLMKIAVRNEQDFKNVSDILLKKPLEPVSGSGELKKSALAVGVEQKAIENKLTTGFSELPEYRAVNMEQQAKLASDLLKKDPELAQKIAMGELEAPKGVIPESVFVAVENKAIAEGNAAVLKDLATRSRLTTEATAMGQRIATLATRDPESPTGAIKEVLKAREERAQKTYKTKDIEKAKQKAVKEIKTELKKPRLPKETWESFIKSLECK